MQGCRTDHREGVGSVDLCSPWSEFSLCELGHCIPELEDRTKECLSHASY